jgi:tRNA-dihydrouridine synthase B
VKDAVRIPVIANGDIIDAATAREALRLSGADGVMVGRGIQGRPWLLAEIAAALHGTPAPEVPKGAALADLVTAHHQAMLDFYGAELGLRVARKHLGWYLDAAGDPARLRRALLTAETPQAARGLIRAAFGARDRVAA